MPLRRHERRPLIADLADCHTPLPTVGCMFRSVLERQVVAAEEAGRTAVEAIDPDAIPASEAVRLFERLDQIVRSATAGRTLLARRVEDSHEWQRKGHRSAAEHVAAVTGTSLGAAKGEMETSKALQ